METPIIFNKNGSCRRLHSRAWIFSNRMAPGVSEVILRTEYESEFNNLKKKIRNGGSNMAVE